MALVLERLEAVALAEKVAGSTIAPGREPDEEREQLPLRIRQTIATALRAFACFRGVSVNRAANELFAAALGVSS